MLITSHHVFINRTSSSGLTLNPSGQHISWLTLHGICSSLHTTCSSTGRVLPVESYLVVCRVSWDLEAISTRLLCCVRLSATAALRSAVPRFFFFFSESFTHTTHTTKAERSAEEPPRRPRCRRVARRPEVATREKTRPPPVSGGSSPWAKSRKKRYLPSS